MAIPELTKTEIKSILKREYEHEQALLQYLYEQLDNLKKRIRLQQIKIANIGPFTMEKMN